MSITVDKVQLEIAIKHDKARQEIAEITDKLQGETKQLKELDKAKKKAMKKYKDESHPEVVKATQAYEEQSKRINALKARKDELRRSLKVEGLSIAEVRDELKKYNMQLANLTPGTEKFNETKKHVDELTIRLKELKSTTDQTQVSLGKFGGGNIFDGLKKTLGAKVDFGQLKTILSANAISGAVTAGLELVADLASRAFDRVKSLVTESVQAARAAEGITHAFQRLDQPGLLQNLRRATHGTVTDLELMKAAVQANDFRLPLDQLGKYLEFAQLKAQQTGQSVDYMTNSIVTGLGRKSPQILDNLGISAAEIKEEMEKTGDMATAVGNIIDRQLADAGEHFEDAAEREARATTDVANAQLQLGQQMQKTFGIGSTSFGEMQAKAEVFILNGLTKTIRYLQQLYDSTTTVRLAVEGVKVVFDTFFKVVQAGFYLLIDNVLNPLPVKAVILSGGSAATNDSDEEQEAETTSFGDLIRQSEEPAEQQKEQLFCALFNGLQWQESSDGDMLVPQPYTDAYQAETEPGFMAYNNYAAHEGFEGSLLLPELDETTYSANQAYQIDTARTVTFETFDPNRIDVRKVYVIGGRCYAVRDCEETITAEGRKPLWKLNCHPMAISDAALYQQWVLADGHWNDGGVWLDDGRWLDS